MHNGALFLLWPSLFILSGAISNCPLLFPSSILGIFTSFCLFVFFMVLTARILEWFETPSSSGPQFVSVHYDSSVLSGPA